LDVGGEKISSRAALTVRCHRHEDETRIVPSQVLVADATAGQVAGSKALDDEISGASQLAEQKLAAFGFNVERDPALVHVVRGPEETLAYTVALVKRRPGAGGIASRRLDLDDVGTQVTEDAPGQKPERAAHIENAIRR